MNNSGKLAQKYLDLDFVSFYLSTEKKGGVRYVKSRGMTPETLVWEIKGHGGGCDSHLLWDHGRIVI